jgi:hypothetical protein
MIFFIVCLKFFENLFLAGGQNENIVEFDLSHPEDRLQTVRGYFLGLKDLPAPLQVGLLCLDILLVMVVVKDSLHVKRPFEFELLPRKHPESLDRAGELEIILLFLAEFLLCEFISAEDVEIYLDS